MKESNIGFLSILLGTPPSKDIYSKTQIERDMMEMIPYTLFIGSIIHAELCTRLDVSYTLSITSRY
jgi:hypothetical protein